ncbi:amino acid/amide ABC transporter substrate-binding protein, HAAT family [Roseivivax lentus]|uniref:Amino acid/amide ABC transporter substrate-binding protein, HAAT family n=1 Tax=Roseivivax lentus TaxID=633194 RepID=A0A1N7KYM5_9RHOB|nr:penicillin-binding protein activator [Roseivivax lentus]SIS66742.1 amino acid/amide ABC transporter substrate-binding protein, HAAT family [Roseivivax lentus]
MFAVFKTARRRLRLAGAALGLFALAACDVGAISSSLPGSGGARVDASRPVPVALLLPRSDPNAGNIPRDLENAARLAMQNLGGVTVDLRVYDTAGQPATASAVAQQAADEGAAIIIGPLYAEAANAAAIAVADDGLSVLSFSNNPTIAGGNLFVLGQTFQNTANRLVSYGVRQGRDDIAVLYQDNLAGQIGRNAIQAAAARNGAQVVGAEAYALNTESLTGAIGRVKPLVDAGTADALFLTDSWEGGLSVVLQLAPEQGISPQSAQYMGLTRWDSRPDGFQLPGIEGAFFALPDRSAIAAFEGRYATAYGAPPHPLAALAFDGIAAVGALVGQGKADAIGPAALTQGAGFQGASGVFRFLPDGTNERGLAVASVRNQQVTILDPAPRAFGGAGF